MARSVQSLFCTQHRAVPNSTNREGFSSFAGTVEEDFVQTLLSNTFGNTYYADKNQLLAEASAVHDRMLKKDTKFFADALVYARQKGFMRTQPIFGLAKLAGMDRDAFARVFDQVILTPNDLADFTTIVTSLRKGASTKNPQQGSQGGRAIKRAAGNWLVKRLGAMKNGEADGQYWTIKYGAEKGDGGFSLKDMLQIYHPKVPGNKRLPLFDYIMGGGKVPKNQKGLRSMDHLNFGKLPKIEQFELLKRATTDREKVEAIQLGELPHEVATSFAGNSKEVWGAIVPNMPIFALMRNLATLERQGVLDSNRKLIEETFSNPEKVQKSKILPYRFLEAAKHVKSSWCQDALRDALELSFVNVPEIQGNTAVLLDVSPSMKPHYRQDDMMRHASIFAVALFKKVQKGDFCEVIAFDLEAFPTKLSARDSLLTQADALGRLGGRGGTNPTAALDHLGNRKVDNLVVITDGEQNAGRPFIDAIDDYRKKVNRNVKVFVLDVSPLRNQIAPTDSRTHYIYGWTDQALQFIAMSSQGWGSQVQAIRNAVV